MIAIHVCHEEKKNNISSFKPIQSHYNCISIYICFNWLETRTLEVLYVEMWNENKRENLYLEYTEKKSTFGAEWFAIVSCRWVVVFVSSLNRRRSISWSWIKTAQKWGSSLLWKMLSFVCNTEKKMMATVWFDWYAVWKRAQMEYAQPTYTLAIRISEHWIRGVCVSVFVFFSRLRCCKWTNIDKIYQ